MDGRSITEVLGVLTLGFVFGGIVPLFLLLLFVKHRGGSAQMYRLIAALKSGKVTDLLSWESSSPLELTREWVGSSNFTHSMFGRDDQIAGHVPSSRAPAGWLLAFGAQTKNSGADGRVLAMTSAHRLELAISSGVSRATLNGQVLGTFRAGEPALLAPDGAKLGTFGPGGQLSIRGRPVATLGTPGRGASMRPSSPTPLVTHLLSERTPEDDAWILVLVTFQLAQASVH